MTMHANTCIIPLLFPSNYSNKGSQKGTSVRVEGKKVFVGHSVFTDNHSDQQGAGIYTYNEACVYQSQFISNTAQRGSGIFVDTGGSLTMKDSDFQLNVALGSGGPAVYVNSEFIAEERFYLLASVALCFACISYHIISYHIISSHRFPLLYFSHRVVIQVEDNT